MKTSIQFITIIFICLTFSYSQSSTIDRSKKISTIDSLLITAEKEIQYDKQIAKELLNNLILLSDSLKYDEGKILAYCNLAFLNYINNDINATQNFAQRALTHSKRINFNTGITKANNIFGLIEWRKGAYSNAIDYYLEALNFAHEVNDKNEIAKSYNYLGLIFWKTGNYPKSFSYLYKSLEIKEELLDKNEIALTLNNLSTVYIAVGNYDESINHAKKALILSKETKNNYSTGRALSNLGICYLKKNKTQDAINYLKEAINLKRESGETKSLAYSLLDIGNIYYYNKDFRNARANFEEALNIMNEINDSHGLSLSFSNLAKIEFKLNNYKVAIENLKKSDYYAKKENLRECLKNNYLAYSEIFEKLGKQKSAFLAYKKYSELKDSIFNDRTRSEINEIKINYETEQKEKENKILKTENELKKLELSYNKIFLIFSITLGVLFLITALLYYFRFKSKTKVNRLLLEKNIEIESHRQELADLNSTKDKFFSIIAHDLRNPFVSLINSSSLLISDFETLSDKDKLTLVKSLNKSAKTNLALLENLLTWARNQKGNIEYRPDYFNITKCINSNLNLFSELAEQKEIRIENHSDLDLFVYADEYMIDTVIRNLIGNAIKFTNRKGLVTISSKLNTNELKITISDNGKGIPKSNLENIFRIDNKVSTSGTDGEPGSGLGLILSKEFVEKNNGEIGVESILEEGSSFWFTLPLSSN